jgi:hypothetical protein
LDFKTEFPDYVTIETIVRQARLERSLRLSELIADAIITSLNAFKAFADRIPVRGSRIQWGPHPLPKASITQD